MSSVFKEGFLEKVVAGALRQTHQAHGDILPTTFGSVAKRVACQLRAQLKLEVEQSCHSHEACNELVQDLRKEITRLRKHRETFQGQIEYWRARVVVWVP